MHFAEIIVDRLERTVPSRILSMPLFANFDKRMLNLLALQCERSAFFPSQAIARENVAGDRMFIINLGRATLEKKNSLVTVKTYSPGRHFGSDVMLGMHRKYAASLVAVTTCHVLSINH